MDLLLQFGQKLDHEEAQITEFEINYEAQSRGIVEITEFAIPNQHSEIAFSFTLAPSRTQLLSNSKHLLS